MTKARTKAEKRRAAKGANPLGLPEIAASKTREPNGRLSRAGQGRDQATETLKARCIQMGKEITPSNMRDMRAPWFGCVAGRVIGQKVMEERERDALWTAIQHMRKVVTAYDAAIGAPRRHAICLRLLAPADGMSADASSPPLDARTPEEKVRAATTALMALEGWLGYADKAAASVAKRVVLEDGYCGDEDGLIQALRCVSDGIKGRRMVYRGRDQRKVLTRGA